MAGTVKQSVKTVAKVWDGTVQITLLITVTMAMAKNITKTAASTAKNHSKESNMICNPRSILTISWLRPVY